MGLGAKAPPAPMLITFDIHLKHKTMKHIKNAQQLLLAVFLSLSFLFTGCDDFLSKVVDVFFGEIVTVNPNDQTAPEVRFLFTWEGESLTVTPESEIHEFELPSERDLVYLILQGEDLQGIKEIRYWSNFGARCTYGGDLGSSIGPSLGVIESLSQSGPRASTKLSHIEKVYLRVPCKPNGLEDYVVYKDFHLVAENFAGQTSEELTIQFQLSSP